MVEQERERGNVVTRCPNMDMFWVVWKCRRCTRARLCNRVWRASQAPWKWRASRDCHNRSFTPSQQLSRMDLKYYSIWLYVRLSQGCREVSGRRAKGKNQSWLERDHLSIYSKNIRKLLWTCIDLSGQLPHVKKPHLKGLYCIQGLMPEVPKRQRD